MRCDDKKMRRSKDLQKRRYVYLRGRKCDNEEILRSENGKMRRYGRCEGDIFHRAEIPENTLYLYSCVKKYIYLETIYIQKLFI